MIFAHACLKWVSVCFDSVSMALTTFAWASKLLCISTSLSSVRENSWAWLRLAKSRAATASPKRLIASAITRLFTRLLMKGVFYCSWTHCSAAMTNCPRATSNTTIRWLAVRLKAEMLAGCDGQGEGPCLVACVAASCGPKPPATLLKLVLLLRPDIVKL